MKVKTKMYFHNSKEQSLDQFINLCEENGIKPTNEAEENACFAGYEIGVNVEWDLETGDCNFLKLSNT